MLRQHQSTERDVWLGSFSQSVRQFSLWIHNTKLHLGMANRSAMNMSAVNKTRKAIGPNPELYLCGRWRNCLHYHWKTFFLFLKCIQLKWTEQTFRFTIAGFCFHVISTSWPSSEWVSTGEWGRTSGLCRMPFTIRTMYMKIFHFILITIWWTRPFVLQKMFK